MEITNNILLIHDDTVDLDLEDWKRDDPRIQRTLKNRYRKRFRERDESLEMYSLCSSSASVKSNSVKSKLSSSSVVEKVDQPSPSQEIQLSNSPDWEEYLPYLKLDKKTLIKVLTKEKDHQLEIVKLKLEHQLEMVKLEHKLEIEKMKQAHANEIKSYKERLASTSSQGAGRRK
jgi:uncharacterized metal-binding protein